MNIEEFPLAVDPTHLYSLWRCDDLETIRMITLTMEKIEINAIYCERGILLNTLTEDQYYATFRRYSFTITAEEEPRWSYFVLGQNQTNTQLHKDATFAF